MQKLKISMILIFLINLKSTFIAENPQPQNIEIGEGGSEYFVGGKPEFKKNLMNFILDKKILKVL